MSWKASSVMEERLRFVARLLDGETMMDVCRDFGISRKTGYKIFDRYKEHGLQARYASGLYLMNTIRTSSASRSTLSRKCHLAISARHFFCR
jgi:transposase-like protein